MGNGNLSGIEKENQQEEASSGGSSSSLYLKPPKAGKSAKQAKPFEFLNLGILAYVGGGEALSQVQFGDIELFNQAGSVGFLLWRSVYVVKQVSTKTRLLVLFDWFKTRIF